MALGDQSTTVIAITLHRMTCELLSPSSLMAYQLDQIMSKCLVSSECDGG